MSINDIEGNWVMYKRLMQAIYGSINSPELVGNCIANLGPFPADEAEWTHWLAGCDMLNRLQKNISVTDDILNQEIDFVRATNNIAAAHKMGPPRVDQINDIMDSLEDLNGAIKRDGRFQAALRIGEALAANIKTTLKK
jgi:hypothetical protein